MKQLESEGAKNGVHAVQIDVTSDDSIKAAAKEVEEKFGRLDVSCFLLLSAKKERWV